MFPRKTLAMGAAVMIMLGTGCSSEVSFQQDVYPILQQRCVSCHRAGGDGFSASGFNVENYEGVMKGTNYGPIIQPGSSVSSTLVLMVKHKTDPSIHMPHGENPLTSEQIEIIEDWIDKGAKNN